MSIMTITFYNWTNLPLFSHKCTSAFQSYSSTALDRITLLLQAITADLLRRDRFDYRVDVCCVTIGAHIQGL
jgi:hypothetical protein